MHQNVLIQMEPSDFFPFENLILRKHITVVNTFLMGCSYFLINIIGNEHVHLFIFRFQLLKKFQNLPKSLGIYPVITIHNFKILSGGMCKS